MKEELKIIRMELFYRIDGLFDFNYKKKQIKGFLCDMYVSSPQDVMDMLTMNNIELSDKLPNHCMEGIHTQAIDIFRLHSKGFISNGENDENIVLNIMT
jgi:hypothetical protein